MNLDAWPESWRDWRGVSGSAVTCSEGGYVLGVTAWSDKAFAGRRLTAVPVRALLAEPGFREVLERHLGRVPDVEPAELVPLLSRPRAAGTPGALLRADAGLTEFAGRETEIAFLERWRDEPAVDGPDVKALLVTGRGGEGKTRLAIELLARSKRDGWTGGMLRQNTPPEQAELATHPGMPLLLVIDYAAARAAGIAALAQTVVRARPQVPVRLLLLARTKGHWWADLVAALEEELPGLNGQVLPLGPLLAAGTGETDPGTSFSATAAALARVPELAVFTGRSATALKETAASLPVPDLSEPRYLHALTVQMAALVALLDTAAPLAGESARSATERVEDTLLRHEKQYRDRMTATWHGLDDLRPVRDRAVAGAALFGARGPTEPDARQAACALVTAALPEVGRQASRQRAVAAWIAGLYPPDEPEPGAETEYWGPVLPDRLGEFLAVRILAAEEPTTGGPGLLESLADQSDLAGIARALLILSRAADHDERAAAWIARLVIAHPLAVGTAALQVAAYAENYTPLRTALIRLGEYDPLLLREAASAALARLPRFSVERLESTASLTREVALVYRGLAVLDRETWLPHLAGSLSDLAVRLAENERRADALLTSVEAVTAYRELAALNRDAYLPDLTRSLGVLGMVLLGNGQIGDAVGACVEALQCASELPDHEQEPLIGTIAGLLRDAYGADGAAAEATFRRVTGEGFPEQLKPEQLK